MPFAPWMFEQIGVYWETSNLLQTTLSFNELYFRIYNLDGSVLWEYGPMTGSRTIGFLDTGWSTWYVYWVTGASAPLVQTYIEGLEPVVQKEVSEGGAFGEDHIQNGLTE